MLALRTKKEHRWECGEKRRSAATPLLIYAFSRTIFSPVSKWYHLLLQAAGAVQSVRALSAVGLGGARCRPESLGGERGCRAKPRVVFGWCGACNIQPGNKAGLAGCWRSY